MNYKRIHDLIIDKRKLLGIPEGYSENHHITPKSFGGSGNKDNMIRLTAREHFIVHRLLAKIYPHTGMVHAIWKMACINIEMKKYKITSRTYDYLRKQHAERVSNDTESALKKSNALKGRPQSIDHIRNRTESRKLNGEWLKEETKIKISESNKGKEGTWKNKKMPSDYVAKRNATRHANGNYKWTEEQKIRSSGKQKGIKRGPKTEEQKKNQRKIYLVNDTIIVENAKQYCIDNSLHYPKFISAANDGNLYKGLKITKCQKIIE